MRLETGSNPNPANNKVSIQVKLGGRSFSAHEVEKAEKAVSIEVVVDTPRVALAPREQITLDTAAELLRIVGKPCRSNEQSVCSNLQADIVAAIAIDSSALASITERWGSRVTFTSPLLDMRHSEEKCLTIDASEEVCYIRHFNNGLQRAEAYAISTAEDVLYHATEWLQQEKKSTPIYIKGEKSTAKLLRKYFKQVICE